MINTIAQTTRKRAHLLATGQATSYGSGTGVDDGALKKGIVKAYTILTTGQYAGVTNIVLNGKVDSHSNNVVIDNNVAVGNNPLMWSRYASASVGPASNGLLPWTTTGAGATAEGIFPYAAAANAAGLAGYSDWRVPNVYELMSILDYEAPTSYPNTVAFPNYPTVQIFCATTVSATVNNGYTINSISGVIASAIKTSTMFLHLVRGG